MRRPAAARHRRWLEAVRVRRPLTGSGLSPLEQATARRLSRVVRAFGRELDELLWYEPEGDPFELERAKGSLAVFSGRQWKRPLL